MSVKRRLGFLLATMVIHTAIIAMLIFAVQMVALVGKAAWFTSTFFSVMIATFVILRLRDKYRSEQRITKIVGLHPNQLPDWKWKLLAKPVALKKLSEVANRLQTLTSEEGALLASQDPDLKNVLEYDQEVSRKKKEFWELQALFLKFGVDVPKTSWNNWGPFSY